MTPFHYELRAIWPGRPETAAAVASKFQSMIERLEAIDPLFQSWVLLADDQQTELKLDAVKDDLVAWVEANVTMDEGEPFPEHGFRLYAASNGSPLDFDLSRTPSLLVAAGSKFSNKLELSVGNPGVPAAPDVISRSAFEQALLTIVSVWGCASGSVTLHPQLNLDSRIVPGSVPSDYGKTGPWRVGYGMSWMAYLSEPLAQGLVVPYEIETERLADGGMILVAADDRPDPDNSQQTAVSGMLSDVLAGRGNAGR